MSASSSRTDELSPPLTRLSYDRATPAVGPFQTEQPLAVVVISSLARVEEAIVDSESPRYIRTSRVRGHFSDQAQGSHDQTPWEI